MDANNQIKIASLNDRIMLYFLFSDRAQGADFYISQIQYSLVLLGIEISENHPNCHAFRTGSFSFNKKYSWSTLKLAQAGLKPRMALVWIDKSQNIFKVPNGIVFKN
jgi:hypothetical protein